MKLLRIIDNKLAPGIAGDLATHKSDLVARGWTVEDVLVAPDNPKKFPFAHRDIAQNIIWPRAKADPTLHVFCIGKVPLPRSGFRQNPDGHANTSGAYPCTLYYAIPSDKWTDLLDNSGYKPTAAFLNKPGDGIWDQDTAPGRTNYAGQEVGGDALCAVGYLNLTPGKNKNWNLGPDKTQWQNECYHRYFKYLREWRTGSRKPRTRFGFGHYQGHGVDSTWSAMTTPNQTSWKNPLIPCDVDTCSPFMAFYDFKAMPANGDWWFKRTSPFAQLYLEWESYQTDWKSSRLINALMTGSVAAVPVAWQFDMTGLESKTLGQLWMQSASRGLGSNHLVLYGDPTSTLN